MIVIVGSLGRAGSTLLFRAITRLDTFYDLSQKSRFRRDVFKEALEDHCVYKTHDYPPESLSVGVKVIWTFADPFDVVASVKAIVSGEDDSFGEYGVNFIEEHFRNLRADPADIDKLLDRDAMNLERHFDRWYRPQGFDCLVVRYETMWNNIEKMRSFLDLPLSLPPQRERKHKFSDFTPSEKEKVRKVYGGLREKIMKADDIRAF